MKFMSKILAIAAALALNFGIGAPAKADALDDIMKRGTLRVAVPNDFPPFGAVTKEMKLDGYDIDMAALIAKELGVKLELVPVSSANRIPYLQTKKADIVISSLGKNAEREKVIDFSAAYAPFFSGVFGPAGAKVAKPEDLAGKTIGVTRGALEDLELTKIAPAGTTIKRFEDNNATMAAFLSGQVEFVATGNVVAAAIIARNPKNKPETKFIMKNSPCYIGFNKGEAKLKEKIDAIIAKAKQDGRLDAISKKWLGLPLPGDLPS